MRNIVNYLAFLLVLLMVFMSIKYPDNVRGLLGRKLSASAQFEDKALLGVLLIGTGYVAIKQGIKDYRSRNKKKTTHTQTPME